MGVATGNVDQQMRTPLKQIRRKASRLNEPCSPQDLSAVTELGRHLDALDRQAGWPEDRVKVRMVSPKSAGCCFGLTHQLPGLTAVALAGRGDSSCQYQAAPCREVRWRGIQTAFQPSSGRQRNLLGFYDSASWQEGVGEPIAQAAKRSGSFTIRAV